MKKTEHETQDGYLLLKQAVVKHCNKRVVVEVYYHPVLNKSVFHILTKKLIDFKTREIVQYEMVLSTETMCILGDLLYTHFLNNEEIRELIVSEVEEGKNFSAGIYVHPSVKPFNITSNEN